MAIRSLLGHGARVKYQPPVLVGHRHPYPGERTDFTGGRPRNGTHLERTDRWRYRRCPAGTMAAAVANSNASTDDLPVIGEANAWWVALTPDQRRRAPTVLPHARPPPSSRRSLVLGEGAVGARNRSANASDLLPSRPGRRCRRRTAPATRVAHRHRGAARLRRRSRAPKPRRPLRRPAGRRDRPRGSAWGSWRPAATRRSRVPGRTCAWEVGARTRRGAARRPSRW